MHVTRRPETATRTAQVRELLEGAAGTLRRYGGSAGEPVFSHLPELGDALDWVGVHGRADEVQAALPVADALGAAWERLGELRRGLASLDGLLDAVAREGVDQTVAVARVRRRRARLAMRARLDALAEGDLAAAYEVAALHDDPLALSVMLDRVDLATARGDWAAAVALVPELLRRTEESGDPLLRAMGLNRSAWAALGAGDLAVARERYERAWAIAGVHEDGVVESRSAAGLAMVACEEGDLEVARSAWRQSLGLAERLHDRAFTLHCLDGIALLLALQGRGEPALALLAAASATRAQLAQPREVPMEALAARVRSAAPEVSGPPMGYVEALAAARAAVARP